MLSKHTQALMEAAVDAIVVIDHQGRMLAINDATCRTFGYRSVELLGQNVNMLMPEPDRSAHDLYLARYLSTGTARIIGIGRQVTALRRDGSVFPVRLSVGRVPDSGPPRFVGLMRDVTTEHEAVNLLKLERDRARAYLELSEAVLIELDPMRRIRDINTRGSTLLGAAPEDLVGRDWSLFIRGEAERDRARLMLTSALSVREPREREFDCVNVSGTPLRVRWRCIALRAADGEAAGWLCAGSDVTEQVERAQSLHVAQDRLTRVARLATMGEMAAGIAHELNQPLTAITTYARACERNLALDKPDMADVSEAVREINAEGLRAGEIIRRLRQMVKVDAPDERVPLEAHTLLEELRSLLQSDARAHDAQLRLSLAPDLPAVTVNAVQIQQVVLNLVRNALEAVQADPVGAREVIVSAGCTEESELEIRVTDNGPGIDAQIQNKLFDPFSTTKSSGTGLGLAISRTIVQSHGGSIGAQPATPRGTTFYVRLPATEEFAR